MYCCGGGLTLPQGEWLAGGGGGADDVCAERRFIDAKAESREPGLVAGGGGGGRGLLANGGGDVGVAASLFCVSAFEIIDCRSLLR